MGCFTLYLNALLFAVFFESQSPEGASTTAIGARIQGNSRALAWCISSICWKGIFCFFALLAISHELHFRLIL